MIRSRSFEAAKQKRQANDRIEGEYGKRAVLDTSWESSEVGVAVEVLIRRLLVLGEGWASKRQ